MTKDYVKRIMLKVDTKGNLASVVRRANYSQDTLEF